MKNSNSITNLRGLKIQEGKTISKFNAVKHGVLLNSVTEYEHDFYSDILIDLQNEYQPVGVRENMLIERIGLCYLKLFRVQKAETEYMKSTLRPAFTETQPLAWGTVNEDGYTPQLTPENVEKLYSIYSRYETTIENRLFRIMHELERAQSYRRGEKVVQALAVDVNHVSSFGERGGDE